MLRSPPFVTFYSFKGGVGRTMALINMAAILASHRGFRVLAIDLDLEAPGLSYLDPEEPYRRAETTDEASRQLGFVDLLSDAKERGREADLFTLSTEDLFKRYTQQVRLPTGKPYSVDGGLTIMPAGKFDGKYSERLDSLGLADLYRAGLGHHLIDSFKRRISDAGAYDYVLIDSRTGFSDEAGICTRDLADHLVILSGLNQQNVEGTREFLSVLRLEAEGSKGFEIVLSPVPTGEDHLFEERESAAKKAFSAAWGLKVDVSLQIPYHPRLALTEEVLIFRRQRGNLFDAYRAIERRVLESLGHTKSAFLGQILSSVHDRDFSGAIRDLSYLVRLDGGRDAVYQVADALADGLPAGLGRKAPKQISDAITLKEILEIDEGRVFMEKAVDLLPARAEYWRKDYLLFQLNAVSPKLLDRLFERILTEDPDDHESLRQWAEFLDNRGNSTEAALYYQKALALNPLYPTTLRNYGDFLARQRDLVTAEQVFRKLVSVQDDSSTNSRLADILARQGKLAEADQSYRSAIDNSSPEDSTYLREYASFLLHVQKDFKNAGLQYEKAFAAEPDDPYTLGDYGQYLVGCGRLEEAEKFLTKGVSGLDSEDFGNLAEYYFSLWLVAQMQSRRGAEWEQRLGKIIQQGFDRHDWDFSPVLAKAKEVLSRKDFDYASALAEALLNEDKVVNLEMFDRWRRFTDQVEAKRPVRIGEREKP